MVFDIQKKAVELYKKSEQLEQEGNIEESNELFLKALHIQAEIGSIMPPVQHSNQFWAITDVALAIYR
jgi:hypothetical protein